MKKVNATQASASKSGFSVKVSDSEKTSKKFDPKNAETVTVLDEKKENQSKQTEVPTTTKVQNAPSSKEETKEVISSLDPNKKVATMQELKEFATIVYLLQDKHTRLIEKRASLDRFAITHNNDNATITVKDANAEEFVSSSPKTIKRLIEFWKEEFNEAIAEVETKLKDVFVSAA